jgi:hypothetical protein
VKKNLNLRSNKEQAEAHKEKLKMDLLMLSREFDKWKKSTDEDKKEIEQKMRERDLLNKDVVTAEEKERDKGGAIQTLENELKKL